MRQVYYGVAVGDGDGDLEVLLDELLFFLAGELEVLGFGEAVVLVPPLFFAVDEELVEVVLELVVDDVPLPLWQETKNATPRMQTIEVRMDFFIG